MDLILMCGLPASGKSTYAKASYQHQAIICPDEIRLKDFGVRFDPKVEPQVWELAYKRVREALEQNKVVCFDATNTTKKRREPLIAIADEMKANAHCVYFPTPLEVCLERDKQRPEPLPAEVFERMSSQFEEPRVEEGFCTILIMNNYC